MLKKKSPSPTFVKLFGVTGWMSMTACFCPLRSACFFHLSHRNIDEKVVSQYNRYTNF